MNNKFCTFITILVISAIILCSGYHINEGKLYLESADYLSTQIGIAYFILSGAILFFLAPIIRFYKLTLQ